MQVGLAILKKTKLEKKICTLRVNRNFRGVGIGKKLIEFSLDWLECEKPLITLRKSKQPQFGKLFDYYGFELAQKNVDYYRMLSSELAFNGVLPKKSIELGNFEQIKWSPAFYTLITQKL